MTHLTPFFSVTVTLADSYDFFSDETPTLALGLCHQVGPVYDMKWHPYGFDKKVRIERKYQFLILLVSLNYHLINKALYF